MTAHAIDEGMDTGDILWQERFSIPLGMPFRDLFRKTMVLGSSAMIRALEGLASGNGSRTVQRHLPCPVHARFVRPGERLIDWNGWPIERAWHFLRGTHGEYPCLPIAEGARGSWEIGEMEREPAGEAPGSVGLDRRGYYAAHREGRVRLKLVAPAGNWRGWMRAKGRAVWRRLRWE